jgi:hypothetical protein
MSTFNLKGVELFEEMPPGWKSLRKRKNDGKVENRCAGKDQPDEDPF